LFKPDGEYTDKNFDETFRINICGPCKTKCQGQSQPAISEMSSDCAVIGKSQFDIKQKSSSDPTAGVTLTYKNGANAFWPTRAVLSIACSPGVDTKVSFVTAQYEDGVYSYAFDVKSKDACPVSMNPGGLWPIGFGGLFLILFIAFVIVYCIVGSLFNKFKLQRSGKEIIPQYNFWIELVFLFKDGFLWMIDGIKALYFLIRQKISGNGYSQV
jgi:hypothetical protein